MKKQFIFLHFILFLSIAAGAQAPQVIAKGTTALIPSTLAWMDADRQTLGSGRGDATLRFSMGGETVTDNDIPAYTDERIQLAKQQQDSYKYLDDGIFLQDGKNIGYIKFSSKEKGKKFFNYQFFISSQEKPLVFIFRSPMQQRRTWEPIIDEFANSVRVTSPEMP